MDEIENHRLKKFTILRKYVSHQEAMELQQKANLLLLIQVNDSRTKGALPGKLFEYLKAQKPILAIGPKQWDAFQIITKTKAGIGLEYQDSVKQYKAAIRQIFETNHGQFDKREIFQFSRNEITKELEKIIVNIDKHK